MALEIERKFLVRGDAWRTGTAIFCCQGYLNRDKNRTVRVRIASDQAFLTVKGPSNGPARPEFEYPVPLEDARQLLELCEKPLIEKRRHLIPHHGFTWEVDEFLGANRGLVVAEIELSSPDQVFARPTWVGEEVTGDPRYANSSLSAHPYTTWPSGSVA